MKGKGRRSATDRVNTRGQKKRARTAASQGTRHPWQVNVCEKQCGKPFPNEPTGKETGKRRGLVIKWISERSRSLYRGEKKGGGPESHNLLRQE